MGVEAGAKRSESPDDETSVAALLSARGIERVFGRRKVLRGLSLQLEAGGVLIITGPNGAGKTSLLDILAGVARPDGGELRVAGIDALDDPEAARATTGYLPDAFPLYEELSPLENLQMVTRLRGRSAGVKSILDMLAKCGVGPRAEDPCKDLSAGMRRRVALAAALLHEPALLVLDEPLASMDSSGRDLVLATLALRRERKRSATVVATHDSGALAPVMTHKLAIEGGTGEVKRVHVDEAIRSVDRQGAISLATNR